MFIHSLNDSTNICVHQQCSRPYTQNQAYQEHSLCTLLSGRAEKQVNNGIAMGRDAQTGDWCVKESSLLWKRICHKGWVLLETVIPGSGNSICKGKEVWRDMLHLKSGKKLGMGIREKSEIRRWMCNQTMRSSNAYLCSIHEHKLQYSRRLPKVFWRWKHNRDEIEWTVSNLKEAQVEGTQGQRAGRPHMVRGLAKCTFRECGIRSHWCSRQ